MSAGQIATALALSGIVLLVWVISWGFWVSGGRQRAKKYRPLVVVSGILTALVFLAAIWIGAAAGALTS